MFKKPKPKPKYLQTIAVFTGMIFYILGVLLLQIAYPDRSIILLGFILLFILVLGYLLPSILDKLLPMHKYR